MNKQISKTVSLILAMTMAMSLAACGKPVEDAAEASPTPEFAYASETLCETENTKENAIAAQPAAITDTGYYAIGGRYVEGVVPEGAVAETEGQFDKLIPCISFVMNDGTVTELSAYSPVVIDTGMEDMRDYRVSSMIECLKLNSDGNIVIAEKVYASWFDGEDDVKYGSEEYLNNLGYEGEFWIRLLNPDGSEISSARMDMTEAEADEASFYNCALDDKGNLLTATNAGITAYGVNGEKAYSIETGNYIYSIAKTPDGKAAVLSYDPTLTKMVVSIVSAENEAFEETSYPLPMDAASIIDGCGDYLFCFNTGSSLFGYDAETQQCTKLLTWMDCDLIASYMIIVSMAEDGSIKAIYTDLYSSDDDVIISELVELKKVPYDASAEKKHLTLATIYPSEVMLNAVIDFNRSHKDVRIDIKDYSEYNTDDDYTAGYMKLAAEIAAGDMPDILDITSDLPYNRYASNGILVDLYPYLENDPELSKDDFFENVLKATEVNGGLYMANSGFAIYTAAGAAAVVGDKPGITYDEYYEALSKMPEGCEGFDLGYDRDTALFMSVALEFPKLINWSTGECRFNSEDFINILNYTSHFDKFDGENYESSPEDATSTRIAEGRQMLALVLMTSVDYMLFDYDAMFGGKATIVGFPTSEGVGNMLYLSSGLAITTKCDDPDTAWEFVRTYFTEEYQKKQYQIPTNKNAFESELKKAMKVEYEKDDNGNYKLDENGERIQVSYGYYFDGTKQVNIYAITEAQAEMLRETIANTNRILNFDESITDIITEGAQAFFEGQKSAEECADLIQSKINIYVNEQK